MAKGLTKLQLDLGDVQTIYLPIVRQYVDTDENHCGLCERLSARLAEVINTMELYMLAVTREPAYAQLLITQDGEDNGHSSR